MAKCKLRLNSSNHYNYSDCAVNINLVDRICLIFVFKPDWWRWPGTNLTDWLRRIDGWTPVELVHRGLVETHNWWASSVQMQLMGQILLKHCSMVPPHALSGYTCQETQSTAVSGRKGNSAESSPRAGDQPTTANCGLRQKKVRKRFQSLNRMKEDKQEKRQRSCPPIWTPAFHWEEAVVRAMAHC